MNYEFMKKDEIVYCTGAKGSKLYIILKGSINVIIKERKKLKEIFFSEEEYKLFDRSKELAILINEYLNNSNNIIEID
jgi:hypothetical protein